MLNVIVLKMYIANELCQYYCKFYKYFKLDAIAKLSIYNIYIYIFCKYSMNISKYLCKY